ncbi:uncharacterized protein EDB91DRAFT_633435 [Suillus paluster]|uniref:uncharacterized protein n=1 Tax=Suillus paluster TaxID=48578 RepID=UPI001B8654EE|nr:uncharacterized protein EDB91DRAFT_633435 [Suillus paluster]KAG1733622.1 hypothetical protein EDB91DRAFT_633435 [Suillus paluster]
MPEPSSSKIPGTSRSNSLASTISNSGASLTRRSRTTKRTRTVTTESRPDGAEEDQVLDISAANSAEPFPSPVPTVSSECVLSPVTTRFETRSSPVSSPVNLQTNSDPERSGGTFGPVGGDFHVVVSQDAPSTPAESQPGSQALAGFTPTIPMKGKGRGNRAMLTSPPSAFRPNPTDSDHARSSVRDSLLTQQSSTSSSLYPLTTSIGTESPPSPLSPTTQDHGVVIPAFDIDGPPTVQEFNADDVSYRLQLLVKNNYFLPPAHSKPSPADFAPCVTTCKKATSPAFLDYFRVGKSRSKPASPDSYDGSPVLRVTSDSTIVSGYGPRGAPQAFRSPKSVQHMARVVVVREKMDDLVAAAKQAEIDLKGRDVPSDRDRGVRRPKVDVFDGIIDPTDAVDVPPPSANYTLALQASALHGLGIEDSVGAAVLAERLPPPGSPGHSISLDPQEEAWRKALLHQVVGHSLNSSAVTLSTAPSTPTRSPRHPHSSESLYQRALMHPRRMLDKKILENPIVDHHEEPEPPIAPTTGEPSGRDLVARLPAPERVRLSSYTPLRAETPVPQTPLAPPPRRQLGTSQYSHSQSHLPAGSTELRRILRKSLSSPILSDFYELRRGPEWARTPMMTPPPLPSLSVSPPPSHRMSRMTALTGLSRFTDDSTGFDEIRSRPSLAISLPTTDGGRRPSSSEYSQPSPTASAFRDRWSNGFYSANSQSPSVDPLPHSRDSSASPHPLIPRPSTMSPPPRPSSSIAGIALSPPPHRSGNLRQPRHSRLHEASSSEFSQGTFRSFNSFSPMPSHSETRGHLPLPLDVNVSIDSFASGIHSAPPPSSPATFFDHIQNHPNAMDDLDDSDDSRSDIDQDMPVYPVPSPHPSLMQLGNRSTPNLARAANESHYQGIPTERNQPVGNVPHKTPYFTSVKASPSSLTHLTLAQHSQEHLTVDCVAPQRPDTPGSENVRRWQKEQQALAESSKRLDGMLIQHMEAEKDTLRRIAQTAKVSKPLELS